MKVSYLIYALSVAVATTAGGVKRAEEKSFIRLSETDARWVTDSEKSDLRLEGKRFIDKTFTRSLGESLKVPAKPYTYPTTASHVEAVTPLFESLSKTNIETHLTTFTTFHNRYYLGNYGENSSAWLLSQVNATLAASGITKLGATAEAFAHLDWEQDSVIATIPGKSASTVIIGAHQDTINQFTERDKPMAFRRAPGADDDGSGSMTILEALRVYLTSPAVLAGEAENTVEFHWYAAEEVGLLGSQAVFKAYAAEGRDVLAMLEQDMTGYTAGMSDGGVNETLGIVTDYVDAALTSFVEMIIDAYCDIPYTETKCGYACSDFASATDAGYPSAFVFEAPVELSSRFIHSNQDTLDTVNYDHMIQHARMILGFLYELAFTVF